MYYNQSEADMQYPSVLDFVLGDVTGDGIPDKIYLTGVRTQSSPYILDITLVIQDGRTSLQISVPLEENAGYNPKLSLWDFTGDGIKDIFIGIDSGGSGGIIFYYIYSFVHNVVRRMFDFQIFNEQYQYSVAYKDNYKVHVIGKYKSERTSPLQLPTPADDICIAEENNKEYILDISNKGNDYLNEIYDENGMLKEPIEGFVDPLSGMYPVDFDSNKVYELLSFQKIAGRYHADGLGYVQNILKWCGNKFVLDSQYVAILGADKKE
ncbi:MAG: hypothetical protein ACERKZ_05470 [Lachnotalea sp.]